MSRDAPSECLSRDAPPQILLMKSKTYVDVVVRSFLVVDVEHMLYRSHTHEYDMRGAQKEI